MEHCVICGRHNDHMPKDCIAGMIREGVKAEVRRIFDVVKREMPGKFALAMLHPTWSTVIKKIAGE